MKSSRSTTRLMLAALLLFALTSVSCRSLHRRAYPAQFNACDSCGDEAPAQCRVPSAIGLPHDPAHATVERAGLRPRCSPGCPASGQCVDQNPDAGKVIPCGDVVDLIFSAEPPTPANPR